MKKNKLFSLVAMLTSSLGLWRVVQAKEKGQTNNEVALENDKVLLVNFYKKNQIRLDNCKKRLSDLVEIGFEGYEDGIADIKDYMNQISAETISDFESQRALMVTQEGGLQKEKCKLVGVDPSTLSPERAQAMRKKLKDAEWIGIFRYFRVNIFDTVNVNSFVPQLRKRAALGKKELQRIRRRYLRLVKKKYKHIGEPLRSWWNTSLFWMVIAGLALLEFGIGFKSLQYFGAFGSNIMVLIFAVFFAGLTAGSAHLAGTALAGKSKEEWPQKKQFWFASSLCLVACIILGGFRLNMDIASLVLIPISILIAVITAALSFKRGEHQELFDLQDLQKSIPVDNTYFEEEANRLQAGFEQAKKDIKEYYLKISQRELEEKINALDDALKAKQDQIKTLDAQEQLSLNSIKEMEREAIEDYKENMRIKRDNNEGPES